MGINEEAQGCKPENSSSPPPSQQQQTNVHVYPDWAAMQAYYGPRMAVPPYYNPAVASGHAPPPYMWGPPQHMMPPPYAAFYPHGGVYAHPAVHLANSALNIDSPAKSSGGSDKGLLKKLKGFDGLAMSIGNPSNGDNNGISHNSGETEGSSEGSDGNTTERGKNGGKRSREGSPIPYEVNKAEPQREGGASSRMMTGVANVSAKVGGGAISANPISALNLKNFPNTAADITSPNVTLMPNETPMQNDRELKREKRKQSNRESARRSRLRKQAEAEELAVKVEALNTENLSLRSEINRLTDDSEKLKLQNAELLGKLKEVSSLSTANLISRVDNNSSGEIYETNKNTRQLLDSSPRADAVAAG